MKNFVSKLFATALMSAALLATKAYAVPVTINMTADNLVAAGGLCSDATCTDGTGWNALGSTAGFSNWTQSTSFSLDLDAGTHHFAWRVDNHGANSSGNPAGLLAEILWGDNANYSSSAWEIYSLSSGALLQNATEYGLNGGDNIWTRVNGGAVSGISQNANWIYGSTNYEDAHPTAWIRTSITIAEVPEPGSVALLLLGLAGIAAARKRVS